MTNLLVWKQPNHLTGGKIQSPWDGCGFLQEVQVGRLMPDCQCPTMSGQRDRIEGTEVKLQRSRPVARRWVCPIFRGALAGGGCQRLRLPGNSGTPPAIVPSLGLSGLTVFPKSDDPGGAQWRNFCLILRHVLGNFVMK